MTMKFKAYFLSGRKDWRTPIHILDELKKEFGEIHDPCPPHNKNELRSEDGLGSNGWVSPVFVNPPYGKEIGKWIKKAYDEWKKGKTVILLIPSRTDTAWWHDYIMKADEIRFIRGRLYFDDGGGRAPFPSVIVVFKGEIRLTLIGGLIENERMSKM